MVTAKSAVSDLFNRYIWLANTVYNAGSITFKDICRKWQYSGANTTGCELNLRTFHNHRKAILELFDIDIECDKHNGWKYYIVNDKSVKDDSLRRWMLSTLAVSNLVHESRDLRDNILLEEIPSGLNFLTQIIEAIRDKNVIEVRHISFWRDAEYTIILKPYCVKLFHQRWYVVGYDIAKEDVRVYALDRFLMCKTLADQFTIPENFDGAEFFNDYFGVFVDGKVELQNVQIKVDDVSVKYLRSLPLHHSQKEIETGKNFSVFEYKIRPTTDFIGELVNMSEYSKVLSPKWIADEVKEAIAKMAKRQRKVHLP